MRKLFKERKLIKGGNYMRKYGKHISTLRKGIYIIHTVLKDTVFPHIVFSSSEEIIYVFIT